MVPVHTSGAARSPFVALAPSPNGTAVLERDGVPVARVAFPRQPRFYGLSTFDGIPLLEDRDVARPRRPRDDRSARVHPLHEPPHAVPVLLDRRIAQSEQHDRAQDARAVGGSRARGRFARRRHARRTHDGVRRTEPIAVRRSSARARPRSKPPSISPCRRSASRRMISRGSPACALPASTRSACISKRSNRRFARVRCGQSEGARFVLPCGIRTCRRDVRSRPGEHVHSRGAGRFERVDLADVPDLDRPRRLSVRRAARAERGGRPSSTRRRRAPHRCARCSNRSARCFATRVSSQPMSRRAARKCGACSSLSAFETASAASA